MSTAFDSLPLVQKRLLALLQYGLWAKNPDATLFEGISNQGWKELMELSAAQGVYALAYDGLNGLLHAFHPSRELMIQWALGVKQIEYKYFLQKNAIQSLAGLYNSADIKCLLIKGLGIGRLYAKPEHRESGDLDIFLFGDFYKGNKLIERRGIVIDYHSDVHSTFSFEGVSVENHLSFLQIERRKVDMDHEILLHQLIELDKPELNVELGVYLPSLSFNLLFLFRHGLKHFLDFGFVLRHLCDWSLLLRDCKNSEQYTSFYNSILPYNMQIYADSFNSIAVEYLGLPCCNDFDVKSMDYFAQRVFSDVMQRREFYQTETPEKFLQVFSKKLYSAVNIFRNRWKFEPINKNMFFHEYYLRFRFLLRNFNKTKAIK